MTWGIANSLVLLVYKKGGLCGWYLEAWLYPECTKESFEQGVIHRVGVQDHKP